MIDMSANDNNKDMKKVFETTELCNYFWSSLPRNQLLANKVWLRQIHYMIEDGGCWIYPDKGLVFEKRGKGFLVKE